MRGVLAGFAAIWAVTAVGWVVGRLDLLGGRAERVLARLVFFVLTPALLFTTLSRSHPARLLTPALAAFAISAGAVALGTGLLARFRWRRRPAESVVAALCASYVNAANLGIPVAAYVLDDVSAVAPVLLFQVLVMAPVALAVLEVAGPASGEPEPGTASAGRRDALAGAATVSRAATVRGPRRVALGRLALLPARNPIMLASAAGIALALGGWRLPGELLRPLELLGSAAVPVALLALGLALAGERPRLGGPDSAPRYALAALKTVGQPLLAYLVGRHALGLDGPALLAAVVTAGLPTAQNVFVFAARYERAERLARDVVLISTLVAAVTLAAAATWLG
jgi:malonate transporter